MIHQNLTPRQQVEARAAYAQVFDPVDIPPLLWTPNYARETLLARRFAAEDNDALVDELLRAQQPLLSGRTTYEFIFTKGALPPPTTATNRALLGHILSLEDRSTIMVINDCCPELRIAETAFAIYRDLDGETDMDTAAVGVTTSHADLAITSPRQVAQYSKLFNDISLHAENIGGYLDTQLANT
ncbi:Scr1 family TA system antitoxin-like transcriptional regulator [Actinoallomurus sp. NBC_01490]|uniref:Scr1 family TA system antitoxin-like transcriptional regulator n=1 Tax=Actinoallomurus sp. NBC_01490 TaxID=2903557 RepID=UPI002E36C6DA|nr:Scr1 family TA system antitoxin-like transcriptional regulator [Actinoallomurus sp. NBC_01490]